MIWNTPHYGVEADLYFLNFHCFARYVKVTFHEGAQIDPLPPGKSKYPEIRYLDVHQDDELGEQFALWVQQASALPGTKL